MKKDRRDYYKKYNQRPEVKKRKKKYYQKPEYKIKKKEYRNRPGIKEHRKKWWKIWYNNHKEDRKEKSKKYYKENLGKRREYEELNKEKIKMKRKEYRQMPGVKGRRRIRYKNDTEYNINCRLRNLFNQMFKFYTKTGKIMISKKYGIDYKAIIKQLKPFPENLLNYEIDHIRPLCSFRFINKGGSTNLKEVKKAFAPENHQWLLVEENRSKGGRW